MMEKFTLWAQALDNSSPDHFNVRDEELATNDIVRRQEAVSSVSSVIKNGTRCYESGGVLLTADARYFVLEVPSVQRDRAGRTAPIICYGLHDTGDIDTLGDLAAAALSDFANRIGRTLPPEHFELTQASFAALKKKKTKLTRTLKIGVLVLALLGIICWLAQKG